MSNIQITADSTCDLSPELIKKYKIKIIPLAVITDDEHLDGVDFEPKDIFDFVAKTKKLPKTAARSKEDFVEFFGKFVEEGKQVVHMGIGAELSSTYANACEAAKEFDGKVFVIETASLSTGTGLLALFASELAQSGFSAKEVYEKTNARVKDVQASFVVDTLEYLYRGGRCSALSLFGANLLKLKPRLQLVNGKIVVKGKYRGKMQPVLQKYIDDILAEYNNPDKTRCFVTHASAEPELVAQIVEYVKSKGIFNEVLETCAGATVTSHCGKGTLGILYINDGGNK